MKYKLVLTIFLNLVFLNYSYSQEEERPVREYTLTIEQQTVNITGKEVMGMTVNGSIPGPTLEFTEGEQAIIHVINKMDVETSIHWHGILLP
ncbi:MAG TPA: copper oxidase, partial [Aequorivita sp.]|nr:copper oxidase [Aequorivita sp.]